MIVRIELVTRCAENLIENLRPFNEEEFLVQSRGMGIWLKLQLAERLEFLPMPGFVFLKKPSVNLRGFLGKEYVENRYTKEGMAWAVFEILDELLQLRPDSFSPLISYLGEAKDADRGFRLSRQIATLYDSYLAYRPEMIMDWCRGGSSQSAHEWQAILWRELRKK